MFKLQLTSLIVPKRKFSLTTKLCTNIKIVTIKRLHFRMEASQKVRNFNSYSNQKGSEKKDYDLDLLFYFFLKSYIISSGVTNQVKI